MADSIPYKNPDGYADPTAYTSLSTVKKEQDTSEMRVQAFIRAIKTLIDQSGYDLLARIEVRDRSTGRNYR